MMPKLNRFQPNHSKRKTPGRQPVKACCLPAALLILFLTACTPLSTAQLTLAVNETTQPATETIQAASPTIATFTFTPSFTPTEITPSATATHSPQQNTQAAQSTIIAGYVQTQAATPAFTATATLQSAANSTPAATSTGRMPNAPIQIYTPGSLSKVISPIALSVALKPNPQGLVRFELIGEDGTLLYRKVENSLVTDSPYYVEPLSIDFQIAGVSEAARLQVSTLDAYQRVIAESSVDLILLSIGANSINPAADGLEPIIIQSPYENQPLTGGTLHLQGMVRPINGNPLYAVLYTSEGKQIGSGTISFNTMLPAGTFRPFSADIKYSVTRQRNVRVEISEAASDIQGNAILSSVMIWLAP